MSRFDDRLTSELERAARPADPAGVFDEIDRRRSRRVLLRRAETALLATAVLAGSLGGVLALNRAFRGDGSTTPAVTPAKNGLIVVSFGDDGGTHLYLQNPDDPNRDPRDHQLTNAGGNSAVDQHPSVSPDGKTVAFDRTFLCHGPIDCPASIWTVPTGGGDAEPLRGTAGGTDPAWSPDGQQIAFARPGSDQGGIYVMDADGSNAVRVLASGDPTFSHPAWSPDGTELTFQTNLPNDIYHVGTVQADGADPILGLPNTPSSTPTQPAWSPDGSTIAFVRGRDIVILEVATGEERKVTTVPYPAPTDALVGEVSPTWSPDGGWIAFERFFSSSEIFTYAIRPDGTDLYRIGLGGDPAWAAAAPQASKPSLSGPPQPTETASAEPGRDIGLGFNLCRLESLEGIDFLGDGANGTAWVGTRLADNGSCPSSGDGEIIAAVDVDGDGSAESWAGPLAPCFYCAPFAATDLNADGVQELVVALQSSAWREYRLFTLRPVTGDGPPELRQVTVAEPGSPPDFRAGKPLSLWAGGDAGVGDYISCEGYPEQPVLIATESVTPIEGPQASQVDVVRLALRADGTVEVIGSDSYTDPGTADPPPYAFTGRACGVAFWPAS